MILCLGDYIEDFYTFGTAVRLCPESPVPVVVPQESRVSAGGVGLVTNQLRELGADVVEWRGSLSRKTRIFAGSHMLCRVDEDSLQFEPEPFPDQALRDCDAVIVADYGKGAIFEEIADELRDSGKPLYIDAKHHWNWYGLLAWAFPNEHESDDVPLCMTKVEKLGARGCRMGSVEIPATVTDAVDTCGAGDIFIASFVWAATQGSKLTDGPVSFVPRFTTVDCLQVANAMAGESCRHRGTFCPSREFAQSVLDRLRASSESRQLISGPGFGSISAGIEPNVRFRHIPAGLEHEGFDNPCAGLSEDLTGQGVILKTDELWQTPRILPSDPTTSDGAQIRAAARLDLIPDMSQSERTDQSPNDSENQCERKSGLDQD